MDYYSLVGELSEEKIIELLNSNKINWAGVIYRLNKHNFTMEQLKDTEFDKVLKQNPNLYQYFIEKLNPKNQMRVFAEDYFKKNIKNINYKEIGRSSSLIKLFLSLYPEQTEALKKETLFTSTNSVLWAGDSMQQIASYINEGQLSVSHLTEVHLKNKFSSAKNDILIDDTHYTNSRYSDELNTLLTLFPRTIAFEDHVAIEIIKKDRKLFCLLPVANQVSKRVFNFATNNEVMVPGGWDPSYDSDPENIPIKSINTNLLDHIEHNRAGVIIATAFIDDNKSNIKNANVQKLINDPEFSKEFGQYHLYLTSEQKKLAGIFDEKSVPDELGEVLHNQSEKTLAAFIPLAKHLYEVRSAFFILLKNKSNLDLLDENGKARVLENFSGLVDRYHQLRGTQLANLVDFVLENEVNKYGNLKAIESSVSTYDEPEFRQLLNKKLNVQEKLEYLEFKEPPKVKKPR